MWASSRVHNNHPIRDYQKCGGLPSNLTPARQSRLNICHFSVREMERSMPEVWNIFGGNRPPPQQHHYHPPTANNRRHHHSHTSVVAQMHYPTAAATSRPMQHYNWPRQSQEVLMCWSDRSVPSNFCNLFCSVSIYAVSSPTCLLRKLDGNRTLRCEIALLIS